MNYTSVFQVFRTVMFSIITVVDISVLSLAARIILLSVTNDYEDFAYAGLAIVISSLTFTIPVIIFVQAIRPQAFTIVTELSWLGFLSLAWVASAGFSVGSAVCNLHDSQAWFKEICVETGVLSGLSFALVLTLLSYIAALLAVNIVSQMHCSPVWKSSVATAKFKLSASALYPEDNRC
ncbi:uncharacterized protein PHACADRAFT_165093 [Phanerochaete carnosa HHB-10118-sp]|uniref:MARVEL domain-containing protein n=1 Tax=Phanerochaete carnosa (strain HHB-10118-sp) TaxID=650164 RepID=K5WN63_PHACS|nr:uncharacterized protein PHACADRAFT_165093 [Phanerochaete carnosa HHB-10118-sp]EKM51762.1 hypothetical protein PHACADRAFT_165093 [Phanerochaete carnosa HHB-10118-sp]